MSIASINPATRETLQTFQELSDADIDATVESVEASLLAPKE